MWLDCCAKILQPLEMAYEMLAKVIDFYLSFINVICKSRIVLFSSFILLKIWSVFFLVLSKFRGTGSHQRFWSRHPHSHSLFPFVLFQCFLELHFAAITLRSFSLTLFYLRFLKKIFCPVFSYRINKSSLANSFSLYAPIATYILTYYWRECVFNPPKYIDL